MAIRLLVLKSADFDRTINFYRALGIPLLWERHGNGPQHLATQVGSTVLEFYPCHLGEARTSEVQIGFDVRDLAAVTDQIRSLGLTVIREPKKSNGELTAIVVDPDGHRVTLYEPLTPLP